MTQLHVLHPQKISKMISARLLETKSHVLPGKLKVAELLFEVPKDYSNPSAGSLNIFARSVTKHENPAVPASPDELVKKAQKPWLVYLQGGPGMGCNSIEEFTPSLNSALDRGYQMLYLDQRGTGLSSTLTADTLALRGDAQMQADYVKLFRADNIVNDCEAIRRTLTADYPPELKKWSIIGQSFGGFCALNYLSFSYQGLREVFTLGGLAPVGKTAEEVYSATFKHVIKRNKAFYSKYPEDVELVHKMVSYIKSKGGIKLPSGGVLTVRRFLTFGMMFGTHGGLDKIHDILLRMRLDLTHSEFLTRPTLTKLESTLGLDDTIIYALLHEPIYCQKGQASNWAAERVGRSLEQYQWLTSEPKDSTHPLYFSGEMIFPFMFDTYPELQKLKGVAKILAEFDDWADLYDEEQLAKNEVPMYSATYIEDMYVDFGFAQETAAKVKGCKQFITNAMYHDALRAKPHEVMEELFALRDDSID